MITSRQIVLTTAAANLTADTTGVRRVFLRLPQTSATVFLGNETSRAYGMFGGQSFPTSGDGVVLADGEHLYANASAGTVRIDVLVIPEPVAAVAPVEEPAETA